MMRMVVEMMVCARERGRLEERLRQVALDKRKFVVRAQRPLGRIEERLELVQAVLAIVHHRLADLLHRAVR